MFLQNSVTNIEIFFANLKTHLLNVIELMITLHPFDAKLSLI